MKKINLENLGFGVKQKLTRTQLKTLVGASGAGGMSMCATQCRNGSYITITCPESCSTADASWVGCNGPIYDTKYCAK